MTDDPDEVFATTLKSPLLDMDLWPIRVLITVKCNYCERKNDVTSPYILKLGTEGCFGICPDCGEMETQTVVDSQVLAPPNLE